MGKVLPLLGRRAASYLPMAQRPLRHHAPEQVVEADRREHHRCGRDSRAPPSPANSSRSRTSTTRSCSTPTRGWEVPLHIDGASGGFVAPFLHPDLKWDFRLPLVKSINASGHKYGLVYPGVGWVVWRSQEDLPEDLSSTSTIWAATCRPSRSTSRAPATRSSASTTTSCAWAGGLHAHHGGAARYRDLAVGPDRPDRTVRAALGRQRDPGVRVQLTGTSLQRLRRLRQAARARLAGPGLHHAGATEDVAVLRIVIREGFSVGMADMLLEDIKKAVSHFEGQAGHTPKAPAPQFAH